MQSGQCDRDQLVVLSSQEKFGFVARCPSGCIHICTGNIAVRFSTKQYWTLMEMLAEAAQKIARPRTAEGEVGRIVH